MAPLHNQHQTNTFITPPAGFSLKIFRLLNYDTLKSRKLKVDEENSEDLSLLPSCSCSQTYFKGVYIICIGNFLVMSKRREEKKCTESYEQENQFHNQYQCNIEVELKGLTHKLSEDKRPDAGWCTMYILQNIVKVGVYLLYITAACLQLCGGEHTPTQHCPEYQHCMEPSHVRDSWEQRRWPGHHIGSNLNPNGAELSQILAE